MTPMTLPVIRFRSPDDRETALAVLEDQQFEVRRESVDALSVTPSSDLPEAHDVLLADGYACDIVRIEVQRLGPGRLPPL